MIDINKQQREIIYWFGKLEETKAAWLTAISLDDEAEKYRTHREHGMADGMYTHVKAKLAALEKEEGQGGSPERKRQPSKKYSSSAYLY